MARKVRDLLSNALYLSVADREFSPIEPDGSYINAAIDSFELILDEYREQIPYSTELIVNSPTELSNLNEATVTYVVYFIGGTRLMMKSCTQREFNGVKTLEKIRAVPIYYWHNKADNKIEIYPDAQTDSDRFEIGFRPLIDINRIDDVLPSAITKTMEQFLKYQLAADLCDSYNAPWSPKKEARRLMAYDNLMTNCEFKPSIPNLPMIGGEGQDYPIIAYLNGLTPGG